MSKSYRESKGLHIHPRRKENKRPGQQPPATTPGEAGNGCLSQLEESGEEEGHPNNSLLLFSNDSAETSGHTGI